MAKSPIPLAEGPQNRGPPEGVPILGLRRKAPPPRGGGAFRRRTALEEPFKALQELCSLALKGPRGPFRASEQSPSGFANVRTTPKELCSLLQKSKALLELRSIGPPRGGPMRRRTTPPPRGGGVVLLSPKKGYALFGAVSKALS